MKNLTSEEYYNRGISKGIQEDYPGAIEDYNMAIEIEPSFAVAYYNRGLIKMILGQDGASFDFSKAAALGYEKAILHWGMDAIAYYMRGNKKVEQQDYQEAIVDFTKAIELDPLYGESYFRRGFTKLRLNQRSSGWMDLSKARELGYELTYQDATKAIACVTSSPNAVTVPANYTNKKNVQIVLIGCFVKFNPDTKERALRYNYAITGGDVADFRVDKKASGLDNVQDEGEHAGKPLIIMLKDIGETGELQRVLKKDGSYDWCTDDIDDILIEAIVHAMSPSGKQEFARHEVREMKLKALQLSAEIKAKRAQAILDAETEAMSGSICNGNSEIHAQVEPNTSDWFETKAREIVNEVMTESINEDGMDELVRLIQINSDIHQGKAEVSHKGSELIINTLNPKLVNQYNTLSEILINSHNYSSTDVSEAQNFFLILRETTIKSIQAQSPEEVTLFIKAGVKAYTFQIDHNHIFTIDYYK